MSSIHTHSLAEVIADFLASNPTPQAILEYRLPDVLQERAQHLLDLHKAEKLSQTEHEEMLEFMHLNRLISIFKAKTMQHVDDQI